MDDCLFCRIIRGEIPSTKVYEDEKVFAFRDINPQAPVHVLVVPKAHFGDVGDLAAKDQKLLGYVFAKCADIALSEGLTNGYRLITNCGADACQSVKHFHVHVLGGAQLTDRMG